MKKVNIAMCCTLLSIAATAQKQEPANLQPDQREYAGYTIQVLAARGGYGYDVLRGKQLLIHQTCNPFTMAPTGLRRKEDVYKLAQWQIGQWSAQGPHKQRPLLMQSTEKKLAPAGPQKRLLPGTNGPRVNQPLPKDIAKELQIVL